MTLTETCETVVQVRAISVQAVARCPVQVQHPYRGCTLHRVRTARPRTKWAGANPGTCHRTQGVHFFIAYRYVHLVRVSSQPGRPIFKARRRAHPGAGINAIEGHPTRDRWGTPCGPSGGNVGRASPDTGHPTTNGTDCTGYHGPRCLRFRSRPASRESRHAAGHRTAKPDTKRRTQLDGVVLLSHATPAAGGGFGVSYSDGSRQRRGNHAHARRYPHPRGLKESFPLFAPP